MNEVDGARSSGKILVTGATGFIGTAVVRAFQEAGIRDLRCLARSSSKGETLLRNTKSHDGPAPEIAIGNLLSREDCRAIVKDVDVIVHLAAGRGAKSFADAYLNSVVTTRNLLDAARDAGRIQRFVNVSSFAVYSNRDKSTGRLLDETACIDPNPVERGDAYAYAKIRQESIVHEYVQKFGLRVVTLRPGVVYGPGNPGIHGRIGIGTFGIFLHLGGGNHLPLTHVDNCARAIVCAARRAGIDGEVFNIVDDEVVTSRQFLRQYKASVARFPSLYVPHAVSYLLCHAWERYAAWSDYQLPNAFNRGRWEAAWRRTEYSNAKAKRLLGWEPHVGARVGLSEFFDACRERYSDA